MTPAELEEKFRVLATPILGAHAAGQVVAAVARLDSLPSLVELTHWLRLEEQDAPRPRVAEGGDVSVGGKIEIF